MVEINTNLCLSILKVRKLKIKCDSGECWSSGYQPHPKNNAKDLLPFWCCQWEGVLEWTYMSILILALSTLAEWWVRQVLSALQYGDARVAFPGDLVSTKSYIQHPFLSCTQDVKRLQERWYPILKLLTPAQKLHSTSGSFTSVFSMIYSRMFSKKSWENMHSRGFLNLGAIK